MRDLQLIRDLRLMREEVLRDEKLILAIIIGTVLTVDLVIAWFLLPNNRYRSRQQEGRPFTSRCPSCRCEWNERNERDR
jgi:hypothetical protein